MGAVIDSSVLIAAERGKLDLARVLADYGNEPVVLAMVTASELLHGIHRAALRPLPLRRLVALVACLPLAACASTSLYRDPLMRKIEDYDTKNDAIVEAIARGADVRVVDWNGFTPLHLAMIHGRDEVVKRLIQGGADVNAQDAEGCRPIDVGGGSGEFETSAMLLLDNGAKLTGDTCSSSAPLFLKAARYWRTPLLARLVAAGATVGAYPTAVAVGADEANDPSFFGRALETARFLVEHGADVNAPLNGDTPLVIATLRGNAPLRAYLASHGATLGTETAAGLASRCALVPACNAAPRCPAPATPADAPAWVCDPEPDGSVYVCSRAGGASPPCTAAVDAPRPPPPAATEPVGDPEALRKFLDDGIDRALADLVRPIQEGDATLDAAQRLPDDLRQWGVTGFDAPKLADLTRTALEGALGRHATFDALGLAAGPKAIVAARLRKADALVIRLVPMIDYAAVTAFSANLLVAIKKEMASPPPPTPTTADGKVDVNKIVQGLTADSQKAEATKKATLEMEVTEQRLRARIAQMLGKPANDPNAAIVDQVLGGAPAPAAPPARTP